MDRWTMQFPTWIDRLPAKERQRERMKFVLRVAAVLATPEGSITALSKRIGMHRNSLNAMLSQGTLDNGLPVNVVKAIESVIGVGVIPREVMNPAVYS